jgi:hypothetical protein
MATATMNQLIAGHSPVTYRVTRIDTTSEVD